MAKNSEARIRANNKYVSKTYEHIQVRVKRGERARLQNYLDNCNISVNGFINSCMSHCIENNIDVSSAKPLGEVLPNNENQSEGE